MILLFLLQNTRSQHHSCLAETSETTDVDEEVRDLQFYQSSTSVFCYSVLLTQLQTFPFTIPWIHKTALYWVRSQIYQGIVYSARPYLCRDSSRGLSCYPYLKKDHFLILWNEHNGNRIGDLLHATQLFLLWAPAAPHWLCNLMTRGINNFIKNLVAPGICDHSHS